mmetsp:Transcript_38911/g.70186  ORF Transcript_38911/g.70186 Transcript_38911/m.70186 type:complete len:136 (+) Transcript_38911:2201-2608(+)
MDLQLENSTGRCLLHLAALAPRLTQAAGKAKLPAGLIQLAAVGDFDQLLCLQRGGQHGHRWLRLVAGLDALTITALRCTARLLRSTSSRTATVCRDMAAADGIWQPSRPAKSRRSDMSPSSMLGKRNNGLWMENS